MKLRKYGITELAENAKKIICFGASSSISRFCSHYYQHKFWDRIIAVADNSTVKQGTKFGILWKYVSIISVDELKELYSKDRDTVLLLTVGTMNCPDVIKQLNSIKELDNMECCIYELLPYCDNFTEIPEYVLRLRSKEPQIPKIIHYIWVGGKPIPEKNLKWMESWRKHCLDYEIKLWNENNYDIESNKYAYEAYKAGKYGFVPDYIRLDILYRYGGIYLDADVELLKCLDDLLYYPAYFGIQHHGDVAPGLGFGAVPGHPLVRKMRDMYDSVSFTLDDGSYNLKCCDYYQTMLLAWHGYTYGNKFSVVENAVIFPAEFFCPLNSAFGIMQITQNCYSIHQYDHSFMDEEKEARIKDNRNTMQRLLS